MDIDSRNDEEELSPEDEMIVQAAGENERDDVDPAKESHAEEVARTVRAQALEHMSYLSLTKAEEECAQGILPKARRADVHDHFLTSCVHRSLALHDGSAITRLFARTSISSPKTSSLANKPAPRMTSVSR